MAKRIAVTARVSLSYEGRTVAAGDPFDVTPIDAAILHRKQQITFGHPPISTKDLIASVDDDPAPSPRRRRYRRRDLTAESA